MMASAYSSEPVRRLAGELVNAWRSGNPLSPAAADRLAPISEDHAYAVQKLVGEALDWFPSGRPRAWKVGAATRDATPTAAPMPDSYLLNAPVLLVPDDFHTLIGIEVELAIRFDRAVPAGASRDDVAAAIGETVAAIEIFDVRAEEWAARPPLFLLADQQMHGRLILGSGAKGRWDDGFGTREVRLAVNGETKICRHGGHPLGDPLYLMPWLAQHAAIHAGGLQAGDLVTTGTWTGLYPAAPGDRIHAAFEGIGEVAVEVAPR